MADQPSTQFVIDRAGSSQVSAPIRRPDGYGNLVVQVLGTGAADIQIQDYDDGGAPTNTVDAQGTQSGLSGNRAFQVDSLRQNAIVELTVSSGTWSVQVGWTNQPRPGSTTSQAVTVANGADTVAGSTTDAAVTTDANGTLSGKLRGLVAILASVRDATNNLLKVRPPSGWAQAHAPAANTQATTSKAAGGVGVKHVCTSITATLAAGAAAPAAVQATVNLRDGATGVGTVLWSAVLSLQAVAGDSRAITLGGLWIEGSAATAMTLEFAAAGGANTVEAVAMTGVDIS